MIALDLFAMIMVADLPNRCMIVLSYHLLQSYGPRKRRDVPLEPLDIEEHTGLHRNNVRRAVKELLDAQILHRQKGGTYRFNKDYETWRPGGKALADRLAGSVSEFAEWALLQKSSSIKVSKKDPIQADSRIKDCPNPTGLLTNDHPNPTGLPLQVSCESKWIASNIDAKHTGVSVTSDQENGSVEILARTSARARNSEFEIREKEEYEEGESPSPFSIESSPVRDPQDQACIDEAITLLGADMRTEAIGLELGRLQSLPGSIEIPGWKWLKAAKRLLSPDLTDGKRTWAYFVGIARNIRDDEREERPAARRETPAERKQREMREGFKRRAEREEAKAREASANGEHLA